jgi:X-X-X-Leu-X-X-Gly heptad repeat protein
MNKTLLLILCDFLLLTLLALTRWETAEPPKPARQAPVPEMAANAVTKDQDLVETMRMSLADEKQARDELAQKLATTDSALAAREQSLTQAQAERARLAQERNAVAATLTETQRAAAELSQKVTAATQEATMTKEQLAQIQRELAEKQAEAERQARELSTLQKQQADAQRQIQGLTMAVVVAEQEKKNLRETADTLKSQVEIERTERVKVQEANTQLAQGVGQLAEKSGELTKEIRENRPVNANVLFNDYLANRVTANFNATRKVFLGSPTRTKDASTVLVTDGKQVYALLHISDTVFSLGENGIDWESLTVELSRSGARTPASAVQFLARDPRVVALPLDPAQATSLGARVYPLAADPFKFPEAVLIDGGGRGYGEVGFKLDPSDPGFVRVDNRLFKRVFGDFAPKRGDLVFAKTGELLGIMVNNDYCAVLKDFTALKTIRPGADIRAQSTGALFDQLITRLRNLPLKLQ